ncbi:hypothetical protein [uncultured Tenacibaculum sp.]|uniref:hypothetical protein n=1 Tax=uncultured Tenacibaculum sp. TaxID=174713 RepID=UPI00261AD084|nr:hypothetical protein [uncultured Tenacibaculum sp.]
MKKISLKKILVLVCLTLSTLIIYNCNDDTIQEQQQKSNVLIENINFSDFANNSDFKKYYNELIVSKKILRRSKKNIIGLKTNLIKHIKTAEKETYTFVVEKNNSKLNQFENLVITKNLNNKEITSVFLKYTMATKVQLDENGKPYPFQGTIEVIPVDEEELDGVFSKSTTKCYRIELVVCTNNVGDFKVDHEPTDACVKEEFIKTKIYTECNTIFGPPSFTNESGGGLILAPSSGGSGYNTNNENSIITSPLPSHLKTEFFEMVSRLTPEQHSFIYKIENASIREEIAEFYEKKNFSKEAEEFIIEAINTIMSNGEVNFETLIINKLTNECAKKTFEELENGLFENHPIKNEIIIPSNNLSLNFSQHILKLFKNSDRTNLIIQNGNLEGANGRTIKSTITIDNSYLSTATKLSIVRTIIHESIHTYLNGIFFSYPGLENLTFRDKMRRYASENNITTPNQLHHEFMSQFIDAMAFSLFEWDKEYGNGLNRNNINGPDDLLGWNYYKSLSWAGLFEMDSNGNIRSMTNSFQTLVPNSNEREKIAKIVFNELKNNSDAKGTNCN